MEDNKLCKRDGKYCFWALNSMCCNTKWTECRISREFIENSANKENTNKK